MSITTAQLLNVVRCPISTNRHFGHVNYHVFEEPVRPGEALSHDTQLHNTHTRV
jgi:hypothetical protein